mmetsp:Transcript_8584/g.25806  ORF Transcript_8584/g.25806 Transcript_8584/m.25806 type:complete len:415 (-) Transcript_8584:44-1288(-)
MSMSDRLSSSEKSVRAFLDNLSHLTREKANAELTRLKNLKAITEGTDQAKSLHPWDSQFYINQFEERKPSSLPRFSLKSCMQGLHMLMLELFGITLRPTQPEPGELWHDDVVKMSMDHEREGVLGYIYFDLYTRPRKFNYAAHFTLRGGRQPEGTSCYQTPLVAIVCNFNKRNSSYLGDTEISREEMETLYHEFGHALHSVLSRTRFHHLSGTRGELDAVEIPSHLFEHFARDHRVLCRFAKDIRGQSITPEDVEKMQASKQRFAGMELQYQIMLSALDIEYHTREDDADWASLYTDLQRKYTGLETFDNHAGHTTFGHIVTYGAGYYSYLYARVLAAEVWRKLFQNNPWSRESGQILRDELLAYGGSRNPKISLNAILGADLSLINYLRDGGLLTTHSDMSLQVLRDRYLFKF